jgi:hypothetical protein
MTEQSQGSKYSFNNPEVVQIIEKNDGTVIGKNVAGKTPAEAAKEIQDLLNQLHQTYPTTTEYQQQVFVNEFNQVVKKIPRVREILLAGGIELIKLLCPPLGIPIEMGRKWLETAGKSN